MNPDKDGRKRPRKPRFQEGERVLCFHGPFLYKAECAKVSVKYKKVKYQVRYFGVKDRDSLKSGVNQSLPSTSEATCQSMDIEEACQPSTSEAEVVYSADSIEDIEWWKGRPSPQADWEDEWLPQSKLLKYSKANLKKFREINRAKEREWIGTGPVTREKASALQREHDQASGVMIPKAKPPRREIIRYAKIDSTTNDKHGYRTINDSDKRVYRTTNDSDKPGCSASNDNEKPGCSFTSDDQPGCSTTHAKPARGRGRPSGKRGRPSGQRVQQSGQQVRPPGQRGRPPRQRGRPRKRPAQTTYIASDSDNERKPDQKLLGNAGRKVQIPEVLKRYLLDDWDIIVGQNQLFHLPARKSVNSILEDYQEHESIFGNTDKKWLEDVREVVIGIKAYFNVMLGSQLLYRFERPQYADVLAGLPGVPLTHIYGAPHLLRLFVKVEEMLKYTPIEQQSLILLLQHMHNFLDYLANNCLFLFNVDEYEVVPLEYLRRVF